MIEAAEYGLCFIAAALVCIAEGLLLLAVLFGGLAVRAIGQWFARNVLLPKIEAEHCAMRED